MKTREDILKMVEETGLHIDLDMSAIDPEKTFKEQGMDSLDFMSFLFELESYFGVKIDGDDMKEGKWSSINRILKMLNGEE